ncbi:hypothetical protein P3S67_025459 [Capsicum chacoense]
MECLTHILAEEFVSVYRMHPLLPDTLQLRNIDATPGPNKSLPLTKEIPMEDLVGGFINQMVSMEHQVCGVLELWNYPVWMRNLVAQDVDGTDRPDHVDLPALEIYRDRERSVGRYNEFRRRMLQIPISNWEDLSEWVNTTESLKDVLDRHYPEITEKWMNSESAFSVWDSSPIPLYFRLPTH